VYKQGEARIGNLRELEERKFKEEDIFILDWKNGLLELEKK
jgi:hypothetical protein